MNDVYRVPWLLKLHSPHQCTHALPEDLLPFSYNHLLFSPTLARFPPEGLGDPGSENSFAEDVAPIGLPDPNDDLLPFASPDVLFWNGLPNGEYGDPDPPLFPMLIGLPLPDSGELL
jgi:hypothetical protein